MPGLLDSEESSNYAAKFWVSVAAEFLGTLLFAFFGGAAPGPSAPLANGIALAVLVYATANVSGGHLNPAITIATIVTGDIDTAKGLLYVVAQIAGAAVASVLHLFLIPGATDVGCFAAAPELSSWQLFGWETIMTFLLVATVYAVAVGQPSFGIAGPLAIGLSVYAAAVAGGIYTGASLNPARTLGPVLVWHCHWKSSWIYVVAEVVGGIIAALLSGPLYGLGPFLGRFLATPGASDPDYVALGNA